MLALHTPVFLYKSFNGEGFNILSEEFKVLEQDLSYVFLSNVNFVICDLRKQVMTETGVRTAHAFAYGTLMAALPKNVNVKADKLKLIETLPEVDYSPYNKRTQEASFFYKKTGLPISEAKELHALNRKVRVKV